MLSFFFNNLDIFLSMAPAAGWDHSAAFTERVTTVAENITHELGFVVHRINRDNPTITVPRRKSGHLDRPKAWND